MRKDFTVRLIIGVSANLIVAAHHQILIVTKIVKKLKSVKKTKIVGTRLEDMISIKFS